jgi:hypothetical protein
MHAVYYYVLIKLPGRELGAVLAGSVHIGSMGATICASSLPWHARHNVGGTLYVLIRSNYGGVRGDHATQLVELRGLIAKPEAELQPAP